MILKLNRKELNQRHMHMILRKKCSTSWIELHLLPRNPEEPQRETEYIEN
jgi:hypothetical protein